MSYTYNQRDSFINDDNFNKSRSHTTSFAWYFMEMSAIELSYTNGDAEISGKAESDLSATKFIVKMEMYEVNLIFTLFGKESIFQPYVKGGAAWVDKRIFRDDALGLTKISPDRNKKDPVPSFGVGARIVLTNHIRLRGSYDRWRSGKDNTGNETWDSALRVGVSYIF